MPPSRQSYSLILLVAFAILISACGGDAPESLWLDPPGWSRAQFLGLTESTNRVPVTRDPAGNLYVGFFTLDDPGGMKIVKFGPSGEREWEVIQSEERFVDGRELQLCWFEDALHAYWIEYSDLLSVTMDPESGRVGALGILVEELQVRSLSSAASADGKPLLAFSGSADEPGIYLLNPAENQEPVLIDPEGINPRIVVDAYSNLHAAWLYQPAMLQDAELRYAVFPGGQIDVAASIYHFPTQYRTTDVIEGPYLGVDLTNVYLGDTAMIRTGMREGEIESSYRTFPVWEPQETVVPNRLFMPTENELYYGQPSYENALQIGRRADWNELTRATDQIVEVVSTGSPVSETAFAFHERVSTQSGQTQAQIGLITLKAGEPQAYQLITNTSTGSKQPNLFISKDSYVFLTWLELTDVRTYSVYLSTTMPGFRSEFDALGLQEWQSMLGDMAFGMFSGLVLFPIAFLWMIPPLVVIAALSFVRKREGSFAQPGNLASLILALVVFQVIKFSIFPSLRTTIPFVQWIPVIPAAWYPVMQIMIPIIVFAISALVALLVVQRRGQTSVVVLFILYALMDGMFTLAIYGGYLFGM